MHTSLPYMAWRDHPDITWTPPSLRNEDHKDLHHAACSSSKLNLIHSFTTNFYFTMSSTTATSESPTTPQRRISWKTAEQQRALDEKKELPPTPLPTNDNPFDNVHAISPPSTPKSSKAPPPPSKEPLVSEDDIEAQHDAAHPTTVSWKRRALAWVALIFVIFLWLLLIVAVLVLTDNFLPGLLRSYHMMKDMSAELANAKSEIFGLQTKVATLYQRIGGWRSVQKAGETMMVPGSE